MLARAHEPRAPISPYTSLKTETSVNKVRVPVQSQVHDLIEGLNDVKINILAPPRCNGHEVDCRVAVSPDHALGAGGPGGP
jgi:hypothetical protein